MVPLCGAGRTVIRGREPPQGLSASARSPRKGSDKTARPATIFIHNGAPPGRWLAVMGELSPCYRPVPRNQTPCFPDRERRSATASADARGLPAPWPRLVGAASVTSAGGLENSWPKSSFVLLLFSFTKAPNDSIRDDLVGMISPAARQAGCARNGWRDAGPRMSDGLGRDSPRVRKTSVLSALTP